VPAGCLASRAISFRPLFDRLTFSLIGAAGSMCSYQHGKRRVLFPYRTSSRLPVSCCTFRFPRAASKREEEGERKRVSPDRREPVANDSAFLEFLSRLIEVHVISRGHCFSRYTRYRDWISFPSLSFEGEYWNNRDRSISISLDSR